MKIFHKTEVFEWTTECQKKWEAIKQQYLDASTLVAPRWDMEFHVHIDASNLAIKAMFSKSYWKCDQLITFASKLLNNAKKNYTTTEREALTMVYALHKFRCYTLRKKFIFYVDHMALLYLVKKPQLLGQIARWLLLFLEYNFLVVYKLGGFHSMANIFSRLPNAIESLGILDKPTNTSLFILQLEWLLEVHTYISIENFPKGYSTKQWKKLMSKALPFTIIDG
jgi:hypothetical protein